MEHIHPLEPIAVIVLIVVFLYLRRRKAAGPAKASPVKETRSEPRTIVLRGGPPRVQEPPEEIFMKMRQQAIETGFATLSLAGPRREDEPYGVIMEMGISSSVVTLACFGDGDASLFYKTGGGMVGGIGHESVRKAAKELTVLARRCLDLMTPTTEYPLPDPDRVRFYVLTPQGVRTTETDRELLSETDSDLAALFTAGQEVVSRMRQVQEQKKVAAPQ